MAMGDQGSRFSVPPSLLQLGRELCSLCKQRVLKEALFGDAVEGSALGFFCGFFGGEGVSL